MNLNLSKKQHLLIQEITKQNQEEISCLGSVQSGKTFSICLGVILYAQELYNYDKDTQYNGAIIGWTTDTLKGNIVDVIEDFLNKLKIPYELKYGQNDKYLKIFNIKYYFFSFNNYLSFNKILGRPLIFVWVDESARIYSQQQLRQSFDEIPGRQLSFVGHQYKKTIHSFNVEGNENHPYKLKYIDGRNNKQFIFYPFDNPKITNEKQMIEIKDLFPAGSLREQKIYNKWVVAEGLVFNKINQLKSLDDIQFREIGIGIDYGSQNATCFIPIALAWHNKLQKWVLVRLETYYHDGRELGTNPTTEYFSNQLRLFMVYIKQKYPHVPITTAVVDSEATHFSNRLIADNIKHETAIKGDGSVKEGVEYLQSLFYKDYFYIYKADSIKHINNDLSLSTTHKDNSLLEFEGYQYDTIKSIREGVDCYKKDNDHTIDATRYLLQLWRLQNKAPTI